MPFNLDLARIYLDVFSSMHYVMFSDLHQYSNLTLREILPELEAIIRIHAILLRDLGYYIDQIPEDSPMYPVFYDLINRMVTEGRTVLATYRDIEAILGIQLSDSNMPYIPF